MRDRLRAFVRRLRQLLTPGGTLTRQSLTSGVWVGAMNVGERGLQILMVVILARILTPEEFGLMGIALLVLMALRRFSRLGLNEALIYHEDENVDAYLNTTWVINAARGAVIAAVVYLGAPFVAAVFNEPEAAPILQVSALGPLLFGLRNPGIVYFKKDLDFHKQFGYRMSGAVVQFVLAVAYAVVFANVWALVVGYISKNVAQTVVSYVVHSHRPFPQFSLDRAKELVDYGKWITGSSIINWIETQGDDFVVGLLLGAASLGFYQMSYRLSNAPATEITHTVSRVAFPAYSKVQDDTQAVRAGFFRVLKLTTVVAVPMAVGIAIVTPTFIRAVLGDQWLPMVFAMQILAVYGLARSLGAMFGPVWQALGHPDFQTKVGGASLVFLAIAIYPATTAFGIEGTALAVVGAMGLVAVPMGLYLTADLIDTSVSRILREITYPVVSGLVMGASVFYVRTTVDLGSAMLELLLLILVGIASYTVTALLVETQFEWGILNEIQSIRKSL